MNSYKCEKCGRLLLKGKFRGRIEVKCNKCKQLNIKESADERQEP